MKVACEKDLRPGEITRFINRISHATFFHTPTWMEALTASFSHFRPCWVTSREGTDLVGIMPCIEISRGPFISLWSLPFGTYGNPLARDPAIYDAILTAFFDRVRSRSCLEGCAYLFDATGDRKLPADVDVTNRECRIVRLEGTFEDYWSTKISKKRRQGCNRAEKAGIEVRVLLDDKEVEEFYRIYRLGSKGWGGVHPYPFRLFMELFRRRDEGVLILGGFKEGKLLGGHINLYFGGMAHGWQAGVSAASHQYDLGSLLVIHAVKEAFRRGMQVYNLGSSGPHSGLLFFKESLGGEEYNYLAASVRKRWWGWLRRR
ncbi:MAG: GNAT family N-acetyltransferase [bacterium]|nr:MAG: GNAT family N-acetyltransferase [bacterium]